MKKQKKWTAWFGLVSFVVIALAAILAAFVPISGKRGIYASFFGAQKYSTELVEKMVVTYNYNADTATIGDAKKACKTIQNYLNSKGYVSATATPVGEDSIEVSLAKPQTGEDLQETMTLLGSYGIGVGAFEIKTSTSSTAEPIIIGSKHVKSVSITSSTGYYYTVVNFTDEGRALIQAAEVAAASQGKSNSYYLFFGGSSSITGSQAFTYANNFVNGDLYIGGFASESVAEQYKLLCEMGSLPVALESAKTTNITFENSVQLATKLSTNQIVLWSFCLAILVGYLLVIALRHGAYAYITAFLINAVVISLALLLFVAMDFVEIYSSSIVAIALSIAILNSFILSMFEKMRTQSLTGKDIDMCIESGYLKSITSTVVVCVTMLVVGIICAVAFSGATQAAAAIIAVFGTLTGLSVLLFEKWIIVALLKLFPKTKATLTWGGENNAK